MSNSKDEHGNQTDKHIIDCNNLKVRIKTNDTLDSYVKMTIKCDVKCSLAQQYTYKRLMEPAQRDEFGYGVGNWTLLDDYESRAKRIAATYARFCLEMEDGSDPRVQGRHYWMGLGAFASKTVACMFDTWQLSAVALPHWNRYPLKSAYEGLAKGNFWLFQDIGSWHFLYNMCNTTANDGGAYESNFVKCRDMKSVNTLCRDVKDVVKDKLPWADSLEVIGNLQKTTGRPQDGVLELGMEKTHAVEMAILGGKRKKDIQKLQLEHLLAIANHEQGNVLQPLIYADPDSYTIDFQDMAVFMRLLGRVCIGQPFSVIGNRIVKTRKLCFPIPEVKLTFTSQCDESEEKLKKIKKFRANKVMAEYDKALNKERDRIRIEILKENGLGLLSEREEALAISSRMEEEEVYGKVPIPDIKEPTLNDILSKPKDGDQLVLENWHDRMKWIVKASGLYHARWKEDPEYMKSELNIIAGWVNTSDKYPDTFYGTDLY
jgi:hypothetical protein